MEYLKRLYKYGELLKVLKLYIVTFSSTIVIDYINLPSEIISKYGVVPFVVVFAVVCIFALIYILQNHILKSFKAKNINELDILIFLTIVFAIFYFVVMLVTPPHKAYKVIILLIVVLLSLILFSYRLHVNKKIDFNETKNANIYDLRDFLETDEIIKTNDYPILFAEKDVDYDLFNRDIIINKLYTSIQACKGTDISFVIGLEGAWGSGKTTIVNNVINIINDKSPDDFIVINNFDPWAYNTQKSLLISLFDKVLKSTGINYSSTSLNAIVNTLFETIKSNNPIGNFIIDVFLQNDFDDGIAKLKNHICDYLEQNDKTIVIFIDNLDRASSSNIIFLLKIINIIFDLKRVVYVLSYDKERVNELLYKNSNINEKFIEKIVQQEISINKLSRQKIHTVVNDCMTKLFKLYGVKKEIYYDFSYIVDYLAGKILDLREFKRIMNSVAPILSLNKELYQPDLFALEIIRFENNSFYEEIYNNSKYYISHDFEVNMFLFKTSFNKNKFNQEGKKYFEEIEAKYERELLLFASNIFPNIKRYLNNVDLRSEYENRDEYKDISLNCRVASAKYFDLYFQFDENEYVFISKAYNSFIESINSKSTDDDIIESFGVFFSIIPNDYHEEIVNKLWLARNDFEINLNYPILIGLINSSCIISKENSFLALSPYQRACATMATLFSLLNDEDKLKVITHLKRDIKNLNICSQIKYWLNSSSIQYVKKEYDVSLFETLICNMYNLIITTPIDIYCDENYRIHNSWTLLQVKRKLLGLENDADADVDIIDYVSKIMKPKYIYRILIDTISTSHSTQGYGYYINEKSLKSFFESDDIVSQYLREYTPKNPTESFVYEVFGKYKLDEPDCFGDKILYTDHYIDLSKIK